jgi:hypothetical protein
MSIQEALPVEPDERLSGLFGRDILGKLPVAGQSRVRRTMLVLIGMILSFSCCELAQNFSGSYASWFTTTPLESNVLLNAVSFVVGALKESSLSLPAANALRDLCDNNRTALASHITAFGELHANLQGISESEKAKVLQSIASVIQALPPDEEIAPVHVLVFLFFIRHLI